MALILFGERMSLILDEKAKQWLAQHSHELPPEELEKDNFMNIGEWPIPRIVATEKFNNISSQKEFNLIVGNPDNWPEIRSNTELYEKWILPQAIILFGKFWFDCVKWKRSIHRGISFPLFSEEDKAVSLEQKVKLEDLPSGKSRIAKIIDKTAYALDVYLKGNWLKEGVFLKKPGGYIIDSLKNEFVREIGSDLGYKLNHVVACPYCLSNAVKKRTPLIENGSRQFTCPKCLDLLKSLEYAKDDELHLQTKLNNVKKFKNFIGITCVCPSNSCPGKFIPLNCIDFKSWEVSNKTIFEQKMRRVGVALKKVSIPKNIQSFVVPPAEIIELTLECPYCATKFSLGSALKSKSGFKEKSGMLTGLPTIAIWEKKCSEILDQSIIDGEDLSRKDNIVGTFFNLEDKILTKQKINILIEEVIIAMSKLNSGPVPSLITWYFFESVIDWMKRYWQDALNYFFDCKKGERIMSELEKNLYPGQIKKNTTTVHRGEEASIHQAIFHIWMDKLEKNINEFTTRNPGIKYIGDFNWFCKPPDFNGPESTFQIEIGPKMKIANGSKIICNKPQKFDPRIARIISIYKVVDGVTDYSKNYMDQIKTQEWQFIKMSLSSGLNVGDKVEVKALLMPGHTTHAPIQRIIRLRTMILSSIINRIKLEEESGNRDAKFWQTRKNIVLQARKITNINTTLEE